MVETRALRVLIVDDNEICAQILARFFTLKLLKDIATFEIAIFQSSEDALDNLEKDCYDIIFTDIEMGGMHGDAMVQIIRDESKGNIQEKNRRIPIVAITGKCDPTSFDLYKKVGISHCQKKPVKKENIYDIITNYIENQHRLFNRKKNPM